MSVALNCEKKVLIMPKRNFEDDRLADMAEMQEMTEQEPVPFSLRYEAKFVLVGLALIALCGVALYFMPRLPW